ncbi:hypothetical protein KI387_029599, partial [Taxus chinensis]
MVFRPKVPDNVQQWQVFNDDTQIAAFLQQKDNFEEIYYEGSNSPPRQTTVGEMDADVSG